MKKCYTPFLVFLLLCFVSCNYFKRNRQLIARDTTITKITSFNSLFIDSARLDSFLAQNPVYADFEDQFHDFYQHRNYEFAWVDTSGLTEQAHHFYNLQKDYTLNFSDSSLYNAKLEELYQKVAAFHSKSSMNAPIVIETELRLTGQFFAYASKVYKGSDLDASQLGWFIPRKKINISALLDSALKNKGEQAAFMVSTNQQYQQLEKYLTQYQNLKRQALPEAVPAVKQSLHPGITDPNIRLIKQKLFLLGDLKVADTSAFFDTVLVKAARNFQQRMGLLADGIIGNNMIGELNVPIADRIKQLLINLERIRWMPIEKASNFVLVNIPEYKLHVFDSGHQVFDMNVIVGTAANNTVIFSAKLSYVVFSPYWNLPSSIVRKEVLPAIRRNGNYLSRNHMEITGYSNGLPIIRQLPGPFNALGLVKFLFPNNYNIYLHDTPNRNLFTETSRGFSHGCIRISDPKKFASYLLRTDSNWNDSTINEAMHLAKEKWVSLQKPVNVYIVYFTAWVDADGQLNFRKDIYDHDKKMEAKLFAN